MKRALISYVIASIAIIALLSTGILIQTSNRKNTRLPSFSYTEVNDYPIIDDFSVNFIEKGAIDINSFNQSHVIRDYIAVEYFEDFTGGFLTIGALKNSTSHSHALLQLLVLRTGESTPEVDYLDFHLNTSYLETEYITAKNIITSLDGINEQSLIYALKRLITLNEFEVDVFAITSNGISFLSTTKLSPERYNSVKDICVVDVNNDKIGEFYIIGEKALESSKFIITEYSYNQTAFQYENASTLEWDITNQQVVALELLEEETKVVFIIASINTTIVNTILTAISINRSIERSFTLEKILQVDFGTIPFRAYSMKKYHQNLSPTTMIVLFGNLIAHSSTQATFCKIGYHLNTFSIPIFEPIFNSPTWSLGGLVADINLDGNDEIILLTYDLPGVQKSKYYLFDGKLHHNLVEEGNTLLKEIRLSSYLKNPKYYIGSWLGKNEENEIVIEFYSVPHIPLKLFNTGEVLLEGNMNNLTLKSYDFYNMPISRYDFNLSIMLQSHPELVHMFNAPDEIALDVYSIQENQVEDILQINITQNTLMIKQISLPIIIAKKLEVTLILPPQPIMSREFENNSPYYTVEIKNNFNFSLNYNITNTQFSNNFIQNYNGVVASGEEESLEFLIMIDFEHTKYQDGIVTYLNTTVGSYIIITEIAIRATNQFITSDLISILIGCIVLVIVILIVLLLSFIKITELKIRKYIEEDEPLDLNLSWFRRLATYRLLQEYSIAKNWELGIKLSSDFKPERLVEFHIFRAKNFLTKGQNDAFQGKLFDAIINWEKARESLVEIGNHQWLDIIDWLLDPLRKIVDIKQTMTAEKRVSALQKEFNALSVMQDQEKIILGITLIFPLYSVAEELGLAYKDINDLQNSLTYLQFAYQFAPDNRKTIIVQEITTLIGLGGVPGELSTPVDHKLMQEKLAAKKIRCFNCGEEKGKAKEVCQNCGSETVICSVCKLPVSFGVGITHCPHCQNIAHSEHLLEWIKIKGSCPVCQGLLKLDEPST